MKDTQWYAILQECAGMASANEGAGGWLGELLWNSGEIVWC
jgi:hypothetical protein